MSARIVTVAQQKGGAGKTTVAAHLAVASAQTGARVAVLDIDPQGSLAGWFDLRAARLTRDDRGLICEASQGWRAKSVLDRLAREYDIVIVDSPPHAETEARIVIRAADLVVVPVQPSPLDLWATRATLQAASRENVSTTLLLNRVPARSSLKDKIEDSARELGVPVLETRLGQRVQFASSMAEGRTASETAPRSQAGIEAVQLAGEILRILENI